MLAFLLKENVPIEEAEDLAGKVREKKMGMLFENMEKMDIQEERRKTEEQRKRTEEQRKRAEAAEQKVKETAKKLEDSIRIFVESCQEFGISQASIKDKLVREFDLDMDSADQAIADYFKEK